MILALVLAVLTAIPPDLSIDDDVDLIEINHFFDENGKLVFDQVIFLDWSPDAGRYQVRAWRKLKRQQQVPIQEAAGGYLAVFHDGDVLRRVRAKSFRETWTQFDVELAEREHLPKDRRPGLTRPGFTASIGLVSRLREHFENLRLGEKNRLVDPMP